MSKVVNSNNLTSTEILGAMGVSKEAVNSVAETIQFRKYCQDCRRAGVVPMTWEAYTGQGSSHWTDSMGD